LLPTEGTQDSTTNQEEQQDNDDVQMQDVAVASPNKVDNDKANMDSIKEIIENNLVAHSNDSVRTNWDEWKELLPKAAMAACKKMMNNFWQRLLLVSTKSV
jgi:hypothetical protein